MSLDERVDLHAGDKRGGSGILKVFDAGLRPTLRDAATLMIVLSDNTATNLVIDVRRLGESSPSDMCALVRGIANAGRVRSRRRRAGRPAVSRPGPPLSPRLPVRRGARPAGRAGDRGQQDRLLLGYARRRRIVRFHGGEGFTYAVFTEHWWPGGPAAAPTISTPYDPR